MENYSPSNFKLTSDAIVAETEDGDPVLLCQYEWSIRQVSERNEGAILRETHLKEA